MAGGGFQLWAPAGPHTKANPIGHDSHQKEDPTSIERVREAVAAMDHVLGREAWFELLEAAMGHPVA